MMSFKVAWTSDCAYTLTPTEKTLRENPYLPENAIIYVEIIEVKSDSYIQTSSSNFSKQKFTYEMSIIK